MIKSADPSYALRRTRRSACLFLGLAVLVVRLAAAPQFVSESELIDRVIDLIDRRLALMPEVAAGKFQQGQPIADPDRERIVLKQSVADARALQFEPEAAHAFFSVQIRLARAVQEHCFEHWRIRGEQMPTARDLVAVLRPELDAIGRELLPAVYLASSALTEMPVASLRPRVARLSRQPGATDGLLAELASALGALRLTAAPTWVTLQRVGILRVGTTGDYAPFSEERGGELRGLDIELAQNLAKRWGLRVVFVRTSWPTLMADLGQRRFDLAASGISTTPERQKVANFSAAYLFDGKTPIARREDAARFSSLEKIDQPGVRVIVNPGGTNERFTREHIKRAIIVLHPDNRTIFQEIIAGRADVMITDGIEVRLQSQRHPELAATMAEPFTRAGKAILLPAGSDLTAEVNAWLVPQVTRGQIAGRLEQALTEAR
jgi:cyclohexadienyl dehydratase